MCIRVKANDILWQGYMTVYVHLMRGEYDNMLKWPFRGDITIQLVNHNNGRDHHEKTVNFSFSSVLFDAGERVTSREIAGAGRGIDQFITHTKVESSTETRRYIDNDCLTFRVTKVAVHFV